MANCRGTALLGLLLVVCVSACGGSDPCATTLAFQEPYDRAERAVQQAVEDGSGTPAARQRLAEAQRQADSIASEASGHFNDCGRPLPGYSIPVLD